jgi:polyhydroxyalkanoate synthesis regulator phasin
MLEPFKKTLLASLGIVAFTREKLTRLIQDLVERGELTREQGKKVVDLLVERGDAEGRNLVERLSDEFERWLGGGPVVTRKEFRQLEERVRALESASSRPAGGPMPEI